MAPNWLRAGLSRYFTPDELTLLAGARIGIAGAGGLGSNTAMLLARSGIENFLILDPDQIEPSNLNRQHYWPDQIGEAKVEALKTQLLRLNPDIRAEALQIALTPDNLPDILSGASVWVEALDEPETKTMFVEKALLAGCRVASASGLAGYGGKPMQKRQIGRLAVVGDFETDVRVAPPLAPRVAQAAAMLADCVLEFILPVQARNP